jgi:hypothetical protein
MADAPRPTDSNSPSSSPRKPWSAPKLLEYGHIGKLTQGSSGNKADGGTTKRKCL